MNLFKELKCCHTEEGQDLFSILAECRTRNNGLKLQEARFRLDIMKNFLTVRAVWQWNQLPREVVGSPTLEAFKRQLDSHLSGMLWDRFLQCAGGWTQWPVGPFQLYYSVILWFYGHQKQPFTLAASWRVLDNTKRVLMEVQKTQTLWPKYLASVFGMYWCSFSRNMMYFNCILATDTFTLSNILISTAQSTQAGVTS